MITTYHLRNKLFDDIRTTLVLNEDGSSEVTQHQDGGVSPGTRHYSPIVTDTLLAAWKEMAERMPTIWEWGEV